MANNVKNTLESLISQYRILNSEIDDCVDKGHLKKRQELLKKISVVSRKIRALETQLSETTVEEQFPNTDWVEIVNKKHELDLEWEREEQEIQKKELKEVPTPQTSEDKDFKRNSIIENIEEKKRLINLTKAISGAPRSEGGISCEKANDTIRLYKMDISNLENELRELEIEQKISAINTPSNTNWSLGDIIFFFIALIIFIAVILYLR